MKQELSLGNIVRLTFPAIISQATILLVSMADLYFVGQFGTNASAAIAFATTTWTVIACFFEGLRLGTTVVMSKLFGAQRHDDMFHVARVGIMTALVAGIILALIAYPFSSYLYENVFTVADPQVVRYGREYLPLILSAGGFVFLTFVIEGIFRGVSRVVIPTIIMLITQTVNIVLDYALTRGAWGFPAMGAKGVAIATFTAYTVAAVVAIIALYTNGFDQLFKKFSFPDRKIMREYWRVAFGIGFHAGFRVFAMLMFTQMLGYLGSQVVAAHQIANQVFLMSYLPTLAFMFTMSMLVSKVVGAKKPQLIAYIFPRVTGSAMAFVTVIGVVMFVMARTIAIAFSPHDPVVVSAATEVIYMTIISQFIVMFNFMMRGILNGTHNTTFLMLASVATTYFVFLPVAYYFTVYLGLGLRGAYFGIIAWNITDTLVNAYKARSVVRNLVATT
jgi:putative MATE family efflux protein